MSTINKTVLITGINGFIGSRLCEFLQTEGYKVVGIEASKASKADYICNVKNRNKLLQILNNVKPDAIIHTAAVKDLISCEKSKVNSWNTNVESTRTLVNYLIDNPKTKLIYLSSDVIFDGIKGDYKENDYASPINWYGTTKLHSELLISQIKNFAICRTALVIGDLIESYIPMLKEEVKNNILKNQTLLPHYIYIRLKNNLPVSLPNNIISSPTHVDLLCKSILKIIQKDLRGIFHTTGSEQISRYDYAVKIAKYHNFNHELISINNASVWKLRPKNIGMNVDRTFDVLELKKEDWDIESINKKILWIEI